MPHLGPFPSKEADLNLYFQAAVPHLIENASRLAIYLLPFTATLPA